MSSFDVYVIHSAKPLGELKGLLDSCGGYVYAGIIYKSLRRQTPGRLPVTEKEETRKTIVFCPQATIQQLELAYPAYKGKIADYNWESFPVPNFEQGETLDLHISGVPKDYTVKDAEDFVKKELQCILPERNCDGCRNYVIEFATRLRETGEIYGFGHIIFDSEVDQKTIKLCKLILHNTPVSFKARGSGSAEKRMVTCVWHRPPQPLAPGEPVVRRIMSRPRPGFEGMRRARPATIQQVDVSELDRNQPLAVPPVTPAPSPSGPEASLAKDGLVMAQ